MNLYLITSNVSGWDTYDGAVVAAKSAVDARTIHPSGDKEDRWDGSSWAATPLDVKAELIGKAKPGTKCGVVFNAFHAG